MYIPFNIKTDYSLTNSIIKIKDLVLFAKENNLKALTITDDNMFGAMEFYNECIKNNIKPIIGLNIKINELDIILYALNHKGYVNLLKISTKYRDNNLTEEYLKNMNEKILCILPYESRSIYNDFKQIYKDIYVSYKSEEEKHKIKIPNKLYMNEILYLKETDKDAYIYFKKMKKEIINNTDDKYLKLDIEDNHMMFEKFDLKIPLKQNLLPNIENSSNILKEECKIGIIKRFGNKVETKYIERLKSELNVINKMGFCDYFLIVSDYVKFAKKNKILVGPGRGSAVGSLVAYVLEITTIDPLKYDLLFERFLNEKRITMPDIDIDFDAERRGEVITYCINKYGIKKVAGVITFATLSKIQAIKELGPIFDIDIQEINYLCNIIEEENLLNYINKFPKIKELYEIASKLEGLKTNMSVNASGIVICKDELDNYVPLEKHNDMYLTGFTMNYLEEIGLLKMDFLALKNLTTISNIINELNIDIENISLNDKDTLELFNEANTMGIFQFETEGMKNILTKSDITSFEDVYNLSALFRPGPKDNIDSYIKRKKGIEKVDYIDKSLEDILKPTYGIIIYQEQIMKIADVLAGYSLKEADVLRRAMSKKKESILLDEKEKFINKSITKGYKQETASKIYDYILKFAEYGFNKSHSVAYAKISYQMAYLKAHYKEYFMKNLLSFAQGSLNSTKEYINECKNNNIIIYTPDINRSSNNYIVDNGIILPFSIIKNLNTGIITNIINCRINKYKNIYDFLTKIDTKLINKEILLNMIKAGCFDSFETRKTLIENIDITFNYIELYKELGKEAALEPNIEKYEEYTKKELINMEYEVFGFYINNNPIEEYRKELNKNKTLSSISNYMNRKIDIIACIDSINEIKTKENKKMLFIKVSDTFSKVDAVVFNDDYDKVPDIKINDIVLINGKVSRRNGKDQLIISELKLI